jgi:hypothetical protein
VVQALLREKDREIGALNSQLSQLCSGGEPSKKEAAEFLVRFTHARARTHTAHCCCLRTTICGRIRAYFDFLIVIFSPPQATTFVRVSALR